VCTDLSNKRHTSSEYCGLFQTHEKTVILENGIAQDRKKKLLIAYLDAAIMAEMAQRNAISAPNVIAFFENKYKIRISPGTLYPILYKLEKKGYIRRIWKKSKLLFALSDSGKQVLEILQLHVDEARGFIVELVNK
jgi:DNA-binding PadR family transcriptional regulator